MKSANDPPLFSHHGASGWLGMVHKGSPQQDHASPAKKLHECEPLLAPQLIHSDRGHVSGHERIDADEIFTDALVIVSLESFDDAGWSHCFVDRF